MTARLTLIRHAHAAQAWGEHADPGLDARGRAEAEAMAAVVAPNGPLPIVVSPMRRTRETAAPLEARWSTGAALDAAVGELKAPPDAEPDHRTWLDAVMASRYADLDEALRAFRDRVVHRARAFEVDTVVVTHFLAINAIVGAATGDDRVVSCVPGYCSRTVVEVDGGALRLVRLGDSAETSVGLG
jgi:broad specificity phosphatase PhoE